MYKTILISLLNAFLSSANLEFGDAAPDFSLKNQDGVLRNLNDYRGSKLVIYFFPKAETPG
tara:strand:+ start:310 stop:492 length:183 start_codon:yes stop_codon:yes gene_type:complete